MARNRQIEIKVSKEEYEKLKNKSNSLGMNISSFLRFVGLSSKIEIST